MSNSGAMDGSPKLGPLPYHERVRDYLKTEEPQVWDWYASHQVRDEHADSIRFDLLKSTYRVDRESQPGIYEAAAESAKKLALDVAVTVYQAQNPVGLNASLAYLPNEAHIVLHGPVASKLDDTELRALLSHELSHLLLWQSFGGEYLVADQVLSAMTLDSNAAPAHHASSRLFGMYTEIFCDRGSLYVVEDPLVVVAALIKIQTELEDVSAASYVAQAEELLSAGNARVGELTHPESFIRTRAVKLWSDGTPDANEQIARMIEGRPSLDELDLLGQQRVAATTRRLLDRLLVSPWLRTDLVVAHAKMFFEDYRASDTGEDATLAADIESESKLVREYYCYVLLDFVTADRELQELPLAAALTLSETLGLKEFFSEIACRELRLRKKQFENIDSQKAELLARAAQQAPAP